MKVFCWCIMSSHVHLIFQSTIQKPEELLRDFKSYTPTSPRFIAIAQAWLTRTYLFSVCNANKKMFFIFELNEFNVSKFQFICAMDCKSNKGKSSLQTRTSVGPRFIAIAQAWLTRTYLFSVCNANKKMFFIFELNEFNVSKF